jgi:hypothetical protein
VHGALLAVVHPDNTPHGYNLTFAFPMLMFIIVAGALFLRFRAAHSVPGHVALRSSRWAGAGKTVGTGTVNVGAEPSAVPAAGAAPEQAAEAGQARPADKSTEDGE